MIIHTEQSIVDFNFWSGAAERAELLTYTELKEVEYQIDELYPDGLEDTQLNDLFWFEFEEVCNWIGLDIDEVLGRE